MAKKDETNAPIQNASEDAYPDIITLEDEDHVEHEYEVLDSVEWRGVRYMELVPYIEDLNDLLNADLQLVMMRTGQDEEGEYLEIVEDTEELCAVSDLFRKRRAKLEHGDKIQ